jgi:YebC/PmpR family DNA-binding regulatory protein
MPNDNFQRAIKKGSGEDGGVTFEQVTYDGYASGGVAMFVEVLTDNKNRSASEIRSIFSKHNGNLGGAGSVAWIFERKGVINVNKEKIGEDELMELVLEAGADDMTLEGDSYEITVATDKFETIKNLLTEKKIDIADANISFIPKNTVKVEGKTAEQVLKLLEALEDHDDVQGAYANFDISDEVLESIES